MLENMLSMRLKDRDEVEENNEDFYYFYQCSTGENLFLHNISFKLLHQEYNQDYTTLSLDTLSCAKHGGGYG